MVEYSPNFWMFETENLGLKNGPHSIPIKLRSDQTLLPTFLDVHPSKWLVTKAYLYPVQWVGYTCLTHMGYMLALSGIPVRYWGEPASKPPPGSREDDLMTGSGWLMTSYGKTMITYPLVN